jgi:small subunit ribosomal protein S21
MIRVQVRPNETLEAALRRFKRQCNYAGVFRLAKKHAYHEKRSDRRRREERERVRNIHRALKKTERKTRVRTMKRSKGKNRSEGEGQDSKLNPLAGNVGEGSFDARGAAEPAARSERPAGSGPRRERSPQTAETTAAVGRGAGERGDD